jgi:hypothetical protein
MNIPEECMRCDHRKIVDISPNNHAGEKNVDTCAIAHNLLDEFERCPRPTDAKKPAGSVGVLYKA